MKTGLHNHLKSLVHWVRFNAFLFGLLSLIWFLLRTGRKPSRAVYPCQQAAAINGQIWLSTYVFPVLSVASKKSIRFSGRRMSTIIAIALIATSATGSLAWWSLSERGMKSSKNQAMTLTGFNLTGSVAEFSPASDIFVVGDTSGNDGGVEALINLMGEHGLLFYKSENTGKNKGPNGLIAENDIILIKVNSQWDQRGGTNTDLLRALIQALVDHPDGFEGEIIVADNGQGQFGSSGNGGSLDWGRSNAEDISQSAQRVVDSFAGSHKVSTYLWDTITTKKVNEYSEGDLDDGYIINATANPRTGIMVSYPKFRTKFGTHVSFKRGIWDPETGTYDSARLKVINVPVLKTHGIYGVTACVKHYMGVPTDKLTARLGSRTHSTISRGGMGTEMVGTRFPILNILDSIWVNAAPLSGPRTSYEDATRVNVIAASTDPVALDHWAAKHILLQAWQLRTNSVSASLDPDNVEPGFFGNWLRLSMQEMARAGYQVTVDEDHMNVYVVQLYP